MITGCPRKSFRDTFWSGVMLREKLGASFPGPKTESAVFAIFFVFDDRLLLFRTAPLFSNFRILRLLASWIKLVLKETSLFLGKNLHYKAISFGAIYRLTGQR